MTPPPTAKINPGAPKSKNLFNSDDKLPFVHDALDDVSNVLRVAFSMWPMGR
jgi:hypothetical protein